MGGIVISILAVASTSFAAAASLFRSDSPIGCAFFASLALVNALILIDRIEWAKRGVSRR